jgi:hypothetical protein
VRGLTLFSLAPKIASKGRFYAGLRVPAPFQLANTPSRGVSGGSNRIQSCSLAAERQAYGPTLDASRCAWGSNASLAVAASSIAFSELEVGTVFSR